MVDQAETELEQVLRFRFCRHRVQERECLHLAVIEVVAIDRLFFDQDLVRSFIVRILIEEIEGLYYDVGTVCVDCHSFLGQLLFDAFVDSRFQFAVILVYGREGKSLELS